MKHQSPVEQVLDKALERKNTYHIENIDYEYMLIIQDLMKARQTEKDVYAVYALFIGKISELIGFEKTAKLLKECKDAIETKIINEDTP